MLATLIMLAAMTIIRGAILVTLYLAGMIGLILFLNGARL
jgi:hypothetical protein